ncbi:hypothetical protein CI105_00020 [Candidatus Izimaplasma bacterium ZiA1]|uniref:phosphatidate cytidylyltransferase n=1 Tax=Candidatus Izimoplasma sp. ZiA1 TaxID=2024899 RepID=UPI000BAA4AB1|nr:hypothetical protein CI105_00020 [Candidatus Izimaplasma bacterium ZiA1]
MKTRLITGIFLVAILVPLFLLGGLYTQILLGLLTIVSIYELNKMFDNEHKINTSKFLIEGIIGLSVFMSLIAHFEYEASFDYLFITILFSIVLFAMGMIFNESYSPKDFGNSLITILYPTIGFASLAILRIDSLAAIGFLFVITTSTDVFAYLVGVNFGKTKLAPKISPKKSVEGSIGGIVFSVIFAYLFVHLLDMESLLSIKLNIFSIGLFTIVFSIVSQIGDLVASKLKRAFDIKDFSKIFPGHGGVLDRFDSAIFLGLFVLLVSKVVEVL